MNGRLAAPLAGGKPMNGPLNVVHNDYSVSSGKPRARALLAPFASDVGTLDAALDDRLQVSTSSLASGGAGVLARFAQPGHPEYLLRPPGGACGACAAAGIPAHEVPSLLRELLPLLDGPPPKPSPSAATGAARAGEPAAARAAPAEWAALVGCARAEAAARDAADEATEALRQCVLDARLNPLPGAEFARRADGLVADAYESYARGARAWESAVGGGALAAQRKRHALQRHRLTDRQALHDPPDRREPRLRPVRRRRSTAAHGGDGACQGGNATGRARNAHQAVRPRRLGRHGVSRRADDSIRALKERERWRG